MFVVDMGGGIAPNADFVGLLIPLEQIQQGVGVEGFVILDAPYQCFRRGLPARGVLLVLSPLSHPFVLLRTLPKTLRKAFTST